MDEMGKENEGGKKRKRKKDDQASFFPGLTNCVAVR